MRHARGPSRLAVAVLLAASVADLRPAGATSYEIGPGDNLQAAINLLLPGDELNLRGGTYVLTSRLSIGVSGTASSPIVIRSKPSEIAHLTRDPSQNVINVEGARHLELRDLEVSQGSHGIRLLDSSFITIDSCHVHDTGDVAISANVPGSSYEALRLTRNHIHDTNGTGEGFYLGCNNAGCVMFNSLIEGNHVHHTVAGTSQGDGIEIKTGSWGNIVRGNWIHDTRYPCILVYGTGGNPVNVIEQNLLYNCGDHGIQAAADAVIRNNLVLGAAGDGIHNQIHQGAVPGNLSILHNTVVNQGDAIRSSDVAGSLRIANNALYSAAGFAIRAAGTISWITAAGNIGTGATQGVSGGFDPGGDLVLDFVDAASRDVHLVAGSRLIAAGDSSYIEPIDFDGAPRGGIADVGAYRFAGPCQVGSLGPIRALEGVKSGAVGASFRWAADAGAAVYHLNSVSAKGLLAAPGPHRSDLSGGAGAAECDAPAGTPSCVDPDALTAPDALRFYQALAACGPDGVDEGPVE